MGVIFFQIFTGIDQLFVGYMGAMSMEDVGSNTTSRQPPFDQLRQFPRFTSLVRSMLAKTPETRCTMAQVADHEWFASGDRGQIPAEALKGILQIDARNEAKLKISELLLDRMNVGNLHALNQAFLAMDRDKSGTITQDEAAQGAQGIAQQMGMSLSEVQNLLFAIADNNGLISYRRFLGAMISQQDNFDTADLWARFCEFDGDRNGVLDKGELREMIKSMGYPAREAEEFLQQMDSTGDGKVSFEEFKKCMIG
jgi:calmodulin